MDPFRLARDWAVAAFVLFGSILFLVFLVLLATRAIHGFPPSPFAVGDLVKVTSGEFVGLEGVLVKKESHLYGVGLDVMDSGTELQTIDAFCLSKVEDDDLPPKFAYGDYVMVTSGFYEGLRGVVSAPIPCGYEVDLQVEGGAPRTRMFSARQLAMDVEE